MIQKGGSLGDFFKTISRKVLNPVYKEVINPVYKTVLKPVVKEVKPFVNPVLKEAKGIGTAVGVDLAGSLLEDAISGKSSKASAKARGQQAGLNAKNMATARVLQVLAQNGNGFPKTDPLIALDNSIEEKPKRKRAQSTGLPPAKRKKAEPKKQPAKRKRTQKGGQLKGRKKRTQTGGFGGIFSTLFDGMQKVERAALKPLRKRAMRDIRKSKKRTKRSGKKRGRKQRGGSRKGYKGKKRKPKKQKGGVRRILSYDDIFNPRATMEV